MASPPWRSARISRELREEAWNAFHAYEEVVVRHVLRHPGWALDEEPLHAALASEDERVVRRFIENLRVEREEFLTRA